MRSSNATGRDLSRASRVVAPNTRTSHGGAWAGAVKAIVDEASDDLDEAVGFAIPFAVTQADKEDSRGLQRVYSGLQTALGSLHSKGFRSSFVPLAGAVEDLERDREVFEAEAGGPIVICDGLTFDSSGSVIEADRASYVLFLVAK